MLANKRSETVPAVFTISMMSLARKEETSEMKHSNEGSENLKKDTEDMKTCCMFEKGQEFDKGNLEFIRNYGSRCNGHSLHTWDEGDRSLFRCRKCGCYVMEQYSEIHMPDRTYIDYIPVRDERHAEEVNDKYDGWSIEREYPYRMVFYTLGDD